VSLLLELYKDFPGHPIGLDILLGYARAFNKKKVSTFAGNQMKNKQSTIIIHLNETKKIQTWTTSPVKVVNGGDVNSDVNVYVFFFFLYFIVTDNMDRTFYSTNIYFIVKAYTYLILLLNSSFLRVTGES